MVSAGCVINDYADRKIDKLIERTQNRPITTGEIHPKSALILFFLIKLTEIIKIQSSVKSIGKCKKNPYIINQNHIFFKKLLSNKNHS
jgi:hypothetical protein